MTLKRFFIIFLLFIIAGAVSFCLFDGMFPMVHGGQNMPLSQDGLMAHILRIQEVSSATASLSMAVLFLMIVAIAALYARVFFLPLAPLSSLRQKRRGVFPVVQRVIHHWLSLFEGSPNRVLKPA